MNSLKVIPLMLIASALWGCQSDSARDQINSQYAADYNAKAMDLQDVVGVWAGSMHLISQDQDFDCVVTLSVVAQNEKSPQSESPSETARIATLGGNISFPALVNLPLQDYPGFQILMNPLDGLSIVDIAYGDYQKSDQSLVLPYLDSQGKSTFGNLSGNYATDPKTGREYLTGIWFANDFGNVGTFDLTRQPETNSLPTVGGRRQ